MVSNPSAYTKVAEEGTTIGEVLTATVVKANEGLKDDVLTLSDFPESPPLDELGAVRRVSGSEDSIQRKQRLREVLPEPQLLDHVQKEQLHDFLADHHQAFCLDREERGETDLVRLHIDTGDTSPKKQPVRRMPFAVREEVVLSLASARELAVKSMRKAQKRCTRDSTTISQPR